MLMTITILIVDAHTGKWALHIVWSNISEELRCCSLTAADREAQTVMCLFQSPQVRESACLWLCINLGQLLNKTQIRQLCGWAKLTHSVTSYKGQAWLVFQSSHEGCYGSIIPEEGGADGNISRLFLEPTAQQAWWAPEEWCLVISDEKMLSGVWSLGKESLNSQRKILKGSVEDSKLFSLWTKTNTSVPLLSQILCTRCPNICIWLLFTLA